MGLQALPAELLCLLAPYLRRNDVLRLLRVCQPIYYAMEHLIYHSIDFSRMLTQEQEWVTYKILYREDLAKVVRVLVLDFEACGQDVESVQSRVIKACRNVTALEIRGKQWAVDPSVTSHLRLERLCIIGDKDTGVFFPVHLGTIIQQRNLTQLIVGIWSAIQWRSASLLPTDLPKLRSVSGSADVLRLFCKDRPVEAINLAFTSIDIVAERREHLSGSIRLSSTSLRRLYLDMPNIQRAKANEMVEDLYALSELIILGMDTLEALTIVCGYIKLIEVRTISLSRIDTSKPYHLLIRIRPFACLTQIAQLQSLL